MMEPPANGDRSRWRGQTPDHSQTLIFWALITLLVIGFMGFFWAFGTGGSEMT